MRFSARALNHLVDQRFLAFPETAEVLQQDVYDVLFVHSGLTAGVRCDDHIVHVPERAVYWQRVLPEMIDGCTCNLAGSQRLQ